MRAGDATASEEIGYFKTAIGSIIDTLYVFYTEYPLGIVWKKLKFHTLPKRTALRHLLAVFFKKTFPPHFNSLIQRTGHKKESNRNVCCPLFILLINGGAFKKFFPCTLEQTAYFNRETVAILLLQGYKCAGGIRYCSDSTFEQGTRDRPA